MPTIESIKRDIHSLGYAQKEEILSYLEEVITLGSGSKEITDNIKESRFSKGKVCPHCSQEEVPGMVNTKTSKDISANLARKHSRISHCHQSITAGMM